MSALQPFAPGDLFVTAATLDESARFPTGQGAVLQFSADWTPRGRIETGHTGLISALCLDHAGMLHALDPQARKITTIGPDGLPVPRFSHLPERAYGSMIALPDGDFLLGEHMVGEVPGFAGDGKVYRITADGTVLASYDTETNGGMGGFLGVTHMALSADGKTLFHSSETGPHIYAHHLQDNRRLGPVYSRTDPPSMVFGLALVGNDRLLVACGNELRIVDPAAGTAIAVPLPEGRGWAVPIMRGEAGPSGSEQLWVLDFFGGRVATIDADTGALAELRELGLAKCLTGIAQVPAR